MHHASNEYQLRLDVQRFFWPVYYYYYIYAGPLSCILGCNIYIIYTHHEQSFNPCSRYYCRYGNVYITQLLSFTTGGACFLPKSLSEALKLFEMETLLSIRARVVPQNLRYVRSAVSDIYTHYLVFVLFLSVSSSFSISSLPTSGYQWIGN